MTDDLTKALAELRRVTPPSSPWEAGDIGVGSSPVDYHIATILNAALSGTMIPRADADLAVELKAENERLRTPQGAAKVLLTISDVEIKPAAKALQDAFNLKGIGWKRYLSALRAAITALQETKP